MNTKIIILFFILTLCLSAFAGDRKGNGADLVVCPDKVTLLDFYESDLQEFNWKGTEQELVIFLMNKISKLSPGRFNNYNDMVNSFYNESNFVKESELGPIADSGNIKKPLPAECNLVQGVIQKHIIFGNEKRYLINKVQWDKLNTINKAGIIFHELVYRELQSLESSKIRHFNYWLFSTGLDGVDSNEFYVNLKAADFKWTYLYGYPMDVQKLIFDNGPVRSRYSYAGKPFKVFGIEVLSKSHIVDSYVNGQPKAMYFTGIISLETPNYIINACDPDALNCKINLTAKGNVSLLNNANIVDKLTGQKFLNKVVKFNELGEVEEIL
jgi:hypothetical protein